MQAVPLSKLKEIRSEYIESTAASEDTGSVITDSQENHCQMVAQAAYFRALARGFEGGNADDDWYAAEAEIAGTYGR